MSILDSVDQYEEKDRLDRERRLAVERLTAEKAEAKEAKDQREAEVKDRRVARADSPLGLTLAEIDHAKRMTAVPEGMLGMLTIDESLPRASLEATLDRGAKLA